MLGVSQRDLSGNTVANLPSPYCPVDFPASLLVVPGSDRATRMTVLSGRKCSGLLRSSGPLGLLEKMCLESLTWHSTIVLLAWRIAVTPAGHSIFQLAASGQSTGEQESSLLPTPMGASDNPAAHGQSNGEWKQKINRRLTMIPTLMAHNLECAGKEYEPGKLHALKLSQAINMLPTPTSRDHKDTGNLENVPVNALLGRELGKNHGLKLQPAFAEWMMGFPEGWTALDASEMPLSRSRSTRSSKQSQTLKTGKGPAGSASLPDNIVKTQIEAHK